MRTYTLISWIVLTRFATFSHKRRHTLEHINVHTQNMQVRIKIAHLLRQPRCARSKIQKNTLTHTHTAIREKPWTHHAFIPDILGSTTARVRRAALNTSIHTRSATAAATEHSIAHAVHAKAHLRFYAFRAANAHAHEYYIPSSREYSRCDIHIPMMVVWGVTPLKP